MFDILSEDTFDSAVRMCESIPNTNVAIVFKNQSYLDSFVERLYDGWDELKSMRINGWVMETDDLIEYSTRIYRLRKDIYGTLFAESSYIYCLPALATEKLYIHNFDSVIFDDENTMAVVEKALGLFDKGEFIESEELENFLESFKVVNLHG